MKKQTPAKSHEVDINTKIKQVQMLCNNVEKRDSL